MDALLLLAPTATSIGYGGRGDFSMTADGKLKRRGERDVVPFVYAGAAILTPAFFEGVAPGPSSMSPLFDRADRARSGSTGFASKGCGCTSARPRRWPPPKLRWWRARRNDALPGARAPCMIRHGSPRLHHSGVGAVPAGADPRADGRHRWSRDFRPPAIRWRSPKRRSTCRRGAPAGSRATSSVEETRSRRRSCRASSRSAISTRTRSSSRRPRRLTRSNCPTSSASSNAGSC